VFIFQNVERALKELRKFAQRVDDAKAPGNAGSEFNERSRLFRDRGVFSRYLDPAQLRHRRNTA